MEHSIQLLWLLQWTKCAVTMMEKSNYGYYYDGFIHLFNRTPYACQLPNHLIALFADCLKCVEYPRWATGMIPTSTSVWSWRLRQRWADLWSSYESGGIHSAFTVLLCLSCSKPSVWHQREKFLPWHLVINLFAPEESGDFVSRNMSQFFPLPA